MRACADQRRGFLRWPDGPRSFRPWIVIGAARTSASVVPTCEDVFFGAAHVRARFPPAVAHSPLLLALAAAIERLGDGPAAF